MNASLALDTSEWILDMWDRWRSRWVPPLSSYRFFQSQNGYLRSTIF